MEMSGDSATPGVVAILWQTRCQAILSVLIGSHEQRTELNHLAVYFVQA